MIYVINLCPSLDCLILFWLHILIMLIFVALHSHSQVSSWHNSCLWIHSEMQEQAQERENFSYIIKLIEHNKCVNPCWKIAQQQTPSSPSTLSHLVAYEILQYDENCVLRSWLNVCRSKEPRENVYVGWVRFKQNKNLFPFLLFYKILCDNNLMHKKKE